MFFENYIKIKTISLNRRFRYCPLCKIKFQFRDSIAITDLDNVNSSGDNQNNHSTRNQRSGNGRGEIGRNENVPNGNARDENDTTGNGRIQNDASVVTWAQLPAWAITRRISTAFKHFKCLICNQTFAANEDMCVCAACLARL